ncbi:haloacid dehalogenase-like hydrolase [Frankia sp. AgB32]|uniref:HAD family hydrolase n=1 Tax=Frankia sp. AgB32 TaxID=631119 RepID=UPI00200F57C3|nr:haloacid dehalogenase-like hydrolase [Frankia sp. AgB32]MCK9894443.1 haloacid dehalogenase-like hydrolase [Frankia sp. AgB32]
MAAPALVLWDIDHTLLNSGGVSRGLYSRAFEQVVGRPLDELADLTGRTERAIVLETLRLGGVTDPEPLLSAFYPAMADAARELRGTMRARGHALPGAHQAVADLVGAGIVQSVVTGNLRPVAETKLAAFNLTEHLDLDVGGYGDAALDRAVLVTLAVTQAEATHDVIFPRRRVVVIGDTIHDVKGALDAGVRPVGVATGRDSAAELAAAGAAAVLADLTDLSALRLAVFGATQS